MVIYLLFHVFQPYIWQVKGGMNRLPGISWHWDKLFNKWQKLDGVGPIDNRPSTKHLLQKNRKKWHITCDTWYMTHDMWHTALAAMDLLIIDIWIVYPHGRKERKEVEKYLTNIFCCIYVIPFTANDWNIDQQLCHWRTNLVTRLIFVVTLAAIGLERGAVIHLYSYFL